MGRVQQCTGVSANQLTPLESFLQGRLPKGADVILTGRYAPFKLLHQGNGQSAMPDFGDGLLGPTMCLVAAGDASRADDAFDGYHGRPLDRRRREAWLRLLLQLNRCSSLMVQSPTPDFATPTARIRP